GWRLWLLESALCHPGGGRSAWWLGGPLRLRRCLSGGGRRGAGVGGRRRISHRTRLGGGDLARARGIGRGLRIRIVSRRRRRGGGGRIDGHLRSRGRFPDEVLEADGHVELGGDDEPEGHIESEELRELPGQTPEQPGLGGVRLVSALLASTPGGWATGALGTAGETKPFCWVLTPGLGSSVATTVGQRLMRSFLEFDTVTSPHLPSKTFSACSTPVHDFHTV